MAACVACCLLASGALLILTAEKPPSNGATTFYWTDRPSSEPLSKAVGPNSKGDDAAAGTVHTSLVSPIPTAAGTAMELEHWHHLAGTARAASLRLNLRC